MGFKIPLSFHLNSFIKGGRPKIQELLRPSGRYAKTLKLLKKEATIEMFKKLFCRKESKEKNNKRRRY